MPKKATKKISRNNQKVVNSKAAVTAVEQKPVQPKNIGKGVLIGVVLVFALWFISYLYVAFVAGFTINPVLQRFEKYNSLENWDTRRHMTDQDIDGDGKRDLISFTGCVVLSSITPAMIPEDKQCTADYIVQMAGLPNGSTGQKYTSDPSKELELSNRPALIEYSYAGKVRDEKWRIYSKEQNAPLRMYQFNNENILEEKPVPWQAKVDYTVFYEIGKILFFIIATPLYIVGMFFSK